jgi:hypothetical protein
VFTAYWVHRVRQNGQYVQTGASARDDISSYNSRTDVQGIAELPDFGKLLFTPSAPPKIGERTRTRYVGIIYIITEDPRRIVAAECVVGAAGFVTGNFAL